MKKSQFAAETLIVYGFSILVISVAMFSLYYFGIRNYRSSIPSTCIFPAGMDCVDRPVISKTGVILALRNNQGKTVQITDIETDACQPNVKQIAVDKTAPYIDLPGNVQDNDVFKINLGCNLGSVDRITGFITVSYTNLDSGLSNSATGEVKGNVV